MGTKFRNKGDEKKIVRGNGNKIGTKGVKMCKRKQ